MSANRSSPASVGRPGASRRLLAAVLRALLLTPLLAAPEAMALEPDLGVVVSRLPQRVEFVAAMDDGATLRRGLGDSPLMLALASVPRPAKVIDAWSQLADDLGMTDAEAFDMLLGRRVVFAASGLQAGADSQWALLTELDPLTERRLRADLGAVPRRLVNGQPVLELEHGSFYLATSSGRLRCGADGRFEATPESAIMLLAPAGDRELFDEMLPLLHCRNPAATLAQTPGGAAAAGLSADDAVFLWRLPDAANAPDRFITGTLGLDGASWNLRAVAGPPRGWLPKTDISRIEPWSPTMLDTLPGEPSLAVIGVREMVSEAQMWLVPLLSPAVPEADLESLEGLLGDRSMLALWLAPESAPGGDPRAEVLVAHEASDIVALSARSDEMMGASARASDGQGDAPKLLEPRDPFQVRTMRLPTLADMAETPPGRSPGEDRSAPAGKGPTLHWTCVAEAGAAGRAGWLIVHFDPTGESAGAEQAPRDADASAMRLPPRSYLHVGRATPDRLTERAVLAAAAPMGAPDSMTSRLLSRVRSLEWAVWLDEQRRAIEVQLTVRAADPERPAQ